ncbi:hypothetical protein BDN72DRAFT_768486 [Pluteus cervinus]|uniref:Uncharacterized protein n=1 Tax=Pluteus cervinus TaxID=181527 RepID=A0ACD3AU36_9AGAR|nr:hypothetical protein BDN72DRAFT_768486 [Pluteus cervinus]
MPELSQPEVYTPESHGRPSLADFLTIDSSASIFFSYAREIELSKIFSEPNEKGITLLVPTNKAVMALARKPHQGPPPADGDDGIIITEEEYDAQSKENINRWIRAHIIPGIISFDEPHTYDTLLNGKAVSFKSTFGTGPKWAHVTLEDKIRITKKQEASNGVLYMIDGVIPVYE